MNGIAIAIDVLLATALPPLVCGLMAYFKAVYWQKGAQELDKYNLLGIIEDDG